MEPKDSCHPTCMVLVAALLRCISEILEYCPGTCSSSAGPDVSCSSGYAPPRSGFSSLFSSPWLFLLFPWLTSVLPLPKELSGCFAPVPVSALSECSGSWASWVSRTFAQHEALSAICLYPDSALAFALLPSPVPAAFPGFPFCPFHRAVLTSSGCFLRRRSRNLQALRQTVRLFLPADLPFCLFLHLCSH